MTKKLRLNFSNKWLAFYGLKSSVFASSPAKQAGIKLLVVNQRQNRTWRQAVLQFRCCEPQTEKLRQQLAPKHPKSARQIDQGDAQIWIFDYSSIYFHISCLDTQDDHVCMVNSSPDLLPTKIPGFCITMLMIISPPP